MNTSRHMAENKDKSEETYKSVRFFSKANLTGKFPDNWLEESNLKLQYLSNKNKKANTTFNFEGQVK